LFYIAAYCAHSLIKFVNGCENCLTYITINSDFVINFTNCGENDSASVGDYSAFFLTVAIGNCMVKLIPPVNFCSDENIQTNFGTRFEDFLNYRTEYNSIS
jgi:hypothetical protein